MQTPVEMHGCVLCNKQFPKTELMEFAGFYACAECKPELVAKLARGESPTPAAEPKGRQSVGTRFFWFVAGAGINYLLIATPFKWLKLHTGLPIWAISACSIGISTTFFFAWNYFINFRTHVRKRDALPRYIGAVACMWLLSSATLTLLKHTNAHMTFSLGKFPLDLDIVATQFFLSGLKFFLYHKWVFPLPKNAAQG